MTDDDVKTYLREQMDLFADDPPDDDYQRGFLACLCFAYVDLGYGELPEGVTALLPPGWNERCN